MTELNFTPFPALTTKRLWLRELRLNDAPEMFIQRSHPEIRKYIKKAPAANIGEAIEFIERMLRQQKNNETITWAITLQGEQKLIGSICLWNIEKESRLAEVGYSLHPDYFGKGIMTEALTAIMAYGFRDMDLHRMDAYTNKNNKASLRLLEKNNFKRNLEFEKVYANKEELGYNVIYTLKKIECQAE